MAAVAVDEFRGAGCGGLQAAGGGARVGLFMALAAIDAPAWLPLWFEVLVESAVSTSGRNPTPGTWYLVPGTWRLTPGSGLLAESDREWRLLRS